MAGLTESQRSVIMTLIDTAPDSAIRSLDLALASDPKASGPMAMIRDLVSVEAGERRTRNLVFAPMIGLCPTGEPAYPRKTFPAKTVSRLWKALKAERRDDIAQAVLASMTWQGDSAAPEVFDDLMIAAAAGLRDPAGTPYAATAIMLDELEPGGAEIFASYLDLAPLAREAISKLPEWLGRMTAERAAAIRVVFRDATDIASDATPRFMEILTARLEEPWQILRIVSAVMDRPHDAFLAASELGYMGERMLSEMDMQFDNLKAFDPAGGIASGMAGADAVRLVTLHIAEFEQTMELKRDGPWGSRIITLKKLMAQKVETLMAKVEAAVAEVLPQKPGKTAKARPTPKFGGSPRPDSLAKAEALLAFIEQIRGPAATGGYASARAKVIEKLDDRIDKYVEDVLEHLRKDEPEDADSARAYLDIAARLVGLLRDEKSAQIVRRRAAA